MNNGVTVTELGYVGASMRPQDADAWRTFAGTVLGFECVDDENGGLYLRLEYWHHRFHLHPSDENDLLYAGFRVAGPREFRAMQKQLADHGVPFEVGSEEDASSRHVLELLRLEDPSGVPLEIFHGPRIDRHRPVHHGRGMHGHFITGSGGLGHAILRDAGLDKSYHFYGEVLGMTGAIEAKAGLGNSLPSDALFMHCNNRQHTVALGAGVGKRLHHVMVEVDNMDDVGLAYDLANKHGVPILIGPGRHANDETFSVYLETPSGFFLEYGFGGCAAPEQSAYYGHTEIWGHKLNDRHLLG